jgi:hypothetical protein
VDVLGTSGRQLPTADPALIGDGIMTPSKGDETMAKSKGKSKSKPKEPKRKPREPKVLPRHANSKEMEDFFAIDFHPDTKRGSTVKPTSKPFTPEEDGFYDE